MSSRRLLEFVCGAEIIVEKKHRRILNEKYTSSNG